MSPTRLPHSSMARKTPRRLKDVASILWPCISAEQTSSRLRQDFVSAAELRVSKVLVESCRGIPQALSYDLCPG